MVVDVQLIERLTELTNLAVTCIEQTGMGHDDVTDMLNITLNASLPATARPKKKNKKQEDSQQNEIAQVYMNLDRQLGDLG